MNTRTWIQAGWVLLSSLSAASAAAAPSLTAGGVSGQAATTVSLPISFDPGAASVAGLQFNLTLPASLSTGAVTSGASLTAAGKSVSANRTGNTWTFVIFGINQNSISSGTLLTAQLSIASGAAAGALSLPVSGVVYSDPNGASITAGAITGGTVTVVSASPVVTSIAVSPSTATIASNGSRQFAAAVKDQFGAVMTGVSLTWASSNASAATVSASGLATGRNTGATALTTLITASASGVTSGPATLTVSAPPDTTAPVVAVSSPAGGSTVSGAVTISVVATDNVGVAGVQLRVDGANLGSELTAAPYRASWDTSSYANGAHTVTAVGRDAAGNSTTVSVSVNVNNSVATDIVAPTAAILLPASGAKVKAHVNVQVSGSDNVAVTRVELWADGAPAKADVFNPPIPAFTTEMRWDAPSLGLHTLQAKVYDAAGNAASSPAVTVEVVRGKRLVSLNSVAAGLSTSADDAADPKALMLHATRGASQSLAFEPEVREAKVTDLRGRVLVQQTRGGGSLLIPMDNLAAESGVWLIQMKDDQGHASMRAMVVVK